MIVTFGCGRFVALPASAVVVVLLWIPGCQPTEKSALAPADTSATERLQSNAIVESELPRPGSRKPSAPINLQMDKSADGKSVTLTATAVTALQSVELRIDQQKMAPVDMAKDQTLTFTVRMADVKAGNELIGAASMMLGSRRIGKAMSLSMGTSLAAPVPETTLIMPDGTVVREAR